MYLYVLANNALQHEIALVPRERECAMHTRCIVRYTTRCNTLQHTATHCIIFAHQPRSTCIGLIYGRNAVCVYLSGGIWRRPIQLYVSFVKEPYKKDDINKIIRLFFERALWNRRYLMSCVYISQMTYGVVCILDVVCLLLWGGYD